MSVPFYAIVVLGAKVRRDRLSPTLRARLDAAHAAFVGGLAARLIVTGCGEAEPMHRYLVDRGVPAEAITLEPRARTTRQNALYVTDLVPPEAPLLVCTQPSHQRRACALFSALGARVEPLHAAEQFSLYRVVRERIAYRLYRLRGWV
jgi:uncharacterized SAM-binding protein YcdF (DUF218 family)